MMMRWEISRDSSSIIFETWLRNLHTSSIIEKNHFMWVSTTLERKAAVMLYWTTRIILKEMIQSMKPTINKSKGRKWYLFCISVRQAPLSPETSDGARKYNTLISLILFWIAEGLEDMKMAALSWYIGGPPARHNVRRLSWQEMNHHQSSWAQRDI